MFLFGSFSLSISFNVVTGHFSSFIFDLFECFLSWNWTIREWERVGEVERRRERKREADLSVVSVVVISGEAEGYTERV